jgi:hypothetical protein
LKPWRWVVRFTIIPWEAPWPSARGRAAGFVVAPRRAEARETGEVLRRAAADALVLVFFDLDGFDL